MRRWPSCPLCGGGNGCAMETARASGEPAPRCWCMDAAIDRAVLARIPAPWRGLACVCARCALAQAHALAGDG